MKTDFDGGGASFRINEEVWGYHVFIEDDGIVTRTVILQVVGELVTYIKKSDKRSVLIESRSTSRTANVFDYLEFTELFISTVKKKVCFAVLAPSFAQTTDKDLLLDIVFNRNLSMQFFESLDTAKAWLMDKSDSDCG